MITDPFIALDTAIDPIIAKARAVLCGKIDEVDDIIDAYDVDTVRNAIDVLSPHIDSSCQPLPYYFECTRILTAIGEHASAITGLRKAHELHGDNLKVNIELGFAFYAAGQHADMQRLFGPLAARLPNPVNLNRSLTDDESLVVIAQVYSLLGSGASAAPALLAVAKNMITDFSRAGNNITFRLAEALVKHYEGRDLHAAANAYVGVENLLHQQKLENFWFTYFAREQEIKCLQTCIATMAKDRPLDSPYNLWNRVRRLAKRNLSKVPASPTMQRTYRMARAKTREAKHQFKKTPISAPRPPA